MDDEMSPKYLMGLIEKVHGVLLSEFSIQDVEFYIRKWHQVFDDHEVNFHIDKHTVKGEYVINLRETLHGIDPGLLLKIAIDLGIETPDLIPSIPIFKNELKKRHVSLHEAFKRSIKEAEEHPDIAIGLANSILESLIKEILKDSRLKTVLDKNRTLYDLTQDILKEFSLFPNASGQMDEIRNIGSGFLSISKNIEKLRSEKTSFHGKMGEDYLVDEPIYAYFIINSIATVGLFLQSFYKKMYPVDVTLDHVVDSVPDDEIKLEDIPF